MTEVEKYLAGINADQKPILEHIQKLIKTNVPEAKELITYGMPGFKYRDKYLIAYGGFKDHMSIYPAANAIETCREELTSFKLSRGTIQFTSENLLNDDLIKKLLAVRIADIESSL